MSYFEIETTEERQYYVLEIYSRKKWRLTAGEFDTIDKADNEKQFRIDRMNKINPNEIIKFRIKEIFHRESIVEKT